MNLKMIVRNLIRNYKMTVLVFAGLVIGITSSIVIYTKLSYELSFDRAHSQSKNTYRVVRVTSGLEYLNGGLEYRTGVYFPLPSEIRQKVPEVQHVVTMFYQNGGTVALAGNEAAEAKEFDLDHGVVFTEPSFFEVFDFGQEGMGWLEGEGAEVLKEPYIAVINQETAGKLFPVESVVGREIIVSGQAYTVGGVIENFPQNTDLPFQVLLSLSTFSEKMYPGSIGDWGSLADSYQCYVVLQDKGDMGKVEQQFKQIYASHTNGNEAEWRTFRLQPLNQVHRESRFGNYNRHTVSGGLMLGITLIGIFIFLIACFNYSNFFLAETFKKEKQTAVRLIMGGRPINIFLQLFSESLLTTTLALLVSLLIGYQLISGFYSFIDIPQGYLPPIGLKSLLFLIVLLFSGGLLSVLFSSIYLNVNSIYPIGKAQVLANSAGGIWLRKGSIVLQFIVAQVVIIGTLFITKQIHFINNKELGYDTENILVSGVPAGIQEHSVALRQELLTVPGVADVSYSSVTPAEAHSWAGLRIVREGTRLNIDAELKYIDAAYLDLYSFEFLAGTRFIATDSGSSVIVNREFITETGFKDADEAIGTFVSTGETQLPIKGVVENFHSGSLHETIRPCLFVNDPAAFNMVNIKLETIGGSDVGTDQGAYKPTIDLIRDQWHVVFPDEVFEYELLTDRIENYYQSEHKAFNLFVLLASISLFLCVLGMLGLSISMNERRTKEIGIRKVNGARVFDVITMLNKDFVIWVGVAFVIAIPISYIAMNKWLQNFAYKTSLSWWIFALAGILALGIALLTVSWQSYRAASRNPVEALRYE